MTFVPHVVGTVSSKWAKGSGGPSGDESYNLLASRSYKQPIAFDAWDNRDSVSGDTTDPVRGGGRVAVASETVVRRLTPLECERLQGLPDDWTAVPFRKQAVAADQNRYRAIGNGWAVPVVRWLFNRLDRVDRGEAVR